MPPSREQVKALWRECHSVRREDRQQFIRARCASDPELEAELTSLLRADEEAGDWLETPALAGMPCQVGPFRVVRALGEGGMGIVYLAVRAVGELEQRVALKVVRAGLGSEAMLRRFEQEQRILSRLEHPSIARLIDAGKSGDGQSYIAMEYVEGQPIDDWCDRNHPTLNQKLILMEQACAAVQHAHQRLVVHRDLKPGNLLVSAEGTLKLLDFGVASLLEEPAGPVTRALMTPEYASPEQVRGEGVTTASDIYSLGVVVYRLVAGRLPYKARMDSALDVAQAIGSQPPEGPTGTDLDDVLLKALEKDPARRYESAAALAADLARFRIGLPVEARRPTFRYLAGKFIHKYRWPVIALAAVVIAISALSAYALRQRATAQRLFRSSRALANSMIWDIEENLRKKTPSEARQVLLTRATDYLEHLQRAQEQEPSVAIDIAEGYRRLGQAQERLTSAAGGSRQNAERSFRTGMTVIDSYLATHGTDARAIRVAAELRYSLGQSKGVQNQGDEARRLLEEAKALYEKAADRTAEQQTSWQTGVDLAAVSLSLGDLKANAGDWESLENSRRETVALTSQLYRKYPAQGEVRLLHARCEKRLGAILTFRNKPEEAVEHYAQALAIDEENYRVSPGPPTRLDLSLSRSEMAGALARLKRTEEARSMFAGALTLRREAYSADRSDEVARNALVRLLTRTAIFERRDGNMQAVLPLLQEAETLARHNHELARIYSQRAFYSAQNNSAPLALRNARKGLAYVAQSKAEGRFPAEDESIAADLEALVRTQGKQPRP